VQIVVRRAQGVVRIRPLWLQPQSCLELGGSVPYLIFIFERETKIVVGERVVRVKLQSFSVIGDRLVPGFLPRELGGPLAITRGRLGDGGRRTH